MRAHVSERLRVAIVRSAVRGDGQRRSSRRMETGRLWLDQSTYIYIFCVVSSDVLSLTRRRKLPKRVWFLLRRELNRGREKLPGRRGRSRPVLANRRRPLWEWDIRVWPPLLQKNNANDADGRPPGDDGQSQNVEPDRFVLRSERGLLL